MLLFAGLLLLPVPLRIGGFELTAYVNAEQPGSPSPKPGATYLAATGFKGEKASEWIIRVGDHSLRIAWVVGG